jgi:class 3 adenylate cyclase
MTTGETTESLHTASADSDRALPFGLLAYLGAGASMLVCYGKTILVAIGILSLNIHFNPHVQAVLMWGLGTVAVFGLVQDRKAHQKNYPVILGAVGVLVIIATLYTHYSETIELSGYIMLLAAAFLNQNIFLSHLNKQVELQARELEELNSSLEERVQEQVNEIERLDRLKRFLAPEVAALITDQGKDSLLDSHRRFIAALFCDLRGFTAFSEGMEPEEVINVLQTYHQRLGRLVAEKEGTIVHRAGDGLMVVFNDPISCDEPVVKAVQLAVEMHRAFADINQKWDKLGYELGFGVGVASGYATLGVVGFEGRYDYTANGNVVNLAARLCDQAENGQILVNQKTYVEIESSVEAQPVGELQLKGVGKSVTAFNVTGLVDEHETVETSSSVV